MHEFWSGYAAGLLSLILPSFLVVAFCIVHAEKMDENGDAARNRPLRRHI